MKTNRHFWPYLAQSFLEWGMFQTKVVERGYTLYDHKTKHYIRREPRITGILDKIDEYRRNRLSHLQGMPQNRIPLKS